VSRWPVVRRTLRELRWQVVSYGLGLGIWAFLVVIIFPDVSEQFADFELPEFYEALFGEQIRDFTEPRTFISIEYFSWVPVVVAVYAVVASTSLLAGEESRGTADFLLTQPVSRRRLYIEKLVGWLLGAIAILLLTNLGFLLGLPLVDMGADLNILHLVGASLMALPVLALFATTGLLLGAITPSRGTASAILTVFVVVSYFAASFAQLTPATGWLRFTSPFYYAGLTDMLVVGIDWWHQALLVAVAALLALLGLLAFERRDIGVEGWQFWRP
jgi:beta-exotoxin I transport system permease protein